MDVERACALTRWFIRVYVALPFVWTAGMLALYGREATISTQLYRWSESHPGFAPATLVAAALLAWHFYGLPPAWTR